MHFQAAAMITGLIWAASAAAQTEPVAVATAFLEALTDRDVVATRALRTPDAVFGAGDIAGPMAEAETVLLGLSQRKCSVGKPVLSSEPVDSNLLGLDSVKTGDGRWVEATMSCPADKGGIKNTPVRVAVVRGKIAAFGF